MSLRAFARIVPFVLPAALCCASCSSQQTLYPVQGKVFFAEKPAHGAVVVFHPANDKSPRARRPSGVVDEKGSFTLGTYSPGDGAAAGEYLVAIAWLEDRSKRDPATGEVPNKLPNRYADPETSKLRVTIKEGPNDLEPFQLTR